MSYLAVPLRDQLTDATSDGRPNENASMNCVGTSDAAIIQYHTGRWVSADWLKDLIYGEAWAGKGTSEDAFIAETAKLGVRVTRYEGTQAALWQRAQEEAAAGKPSILSIPSMWESQPSQPNYTPWSPQFSTHAVVFCGISNGVGRMMNPWHGVYMDRPTSWFAPRLCFGAIYLTERSEHVGVPQGWTDDGTTLTAPNGVVVVHGFRDWVLNHPWDTLDWPLAAEYGAASIEPGNAAIGAGTRQDFRMTSLGYTTAKGVYRVWTGQDLAALSAQVADLQAKLANASAPDPVAAKWLSVGNLIKSALGEL